MAIWTQRVAAHLVALVILLGASAAVGQAPPTCSDTRSHQFDFWIGEWEVYSGEALAGHNSIEPIVDGCVLQETWRGSSGSAGTSFNFFNPEKGKWQQFWVWRNGTTLELEGGYSEGKMILQGESRDQEGKPIQNRITWHDNADGSVRQHWEISQDSGETWATAFDGLYRKND
jgi:hypothetical protein